MPARIFRETKYNVSSEKLHTKPQNGQWMFRGSVDFQWILGTVPGIEMMREPQSNYGTNGKPMSLKDDFCSGSDIFILL